MGFLGESSNVVVIGFILTIAMFVVHLIGFATPYWYGNSNSHIGLWESCGGGICVSLTVYSSQWKAAQAMECLAFIAFLAAVIFIVVKLFAMKDNSMLYIVIAITALVAGILSMLGVIIFGTIEGLASNRFHFSFAFCIIASLGAFVAGVLVIIGRNK